MFLSAVFSKQLRFTIINMKMERNINKNNHEAAISLFMP